MTCQQSLFLNAGKMAIVKLYELSLRACEVNQVELLFENRSGLIVWTLPLLKGFYVSQNENVKFIQKKMEGP